MTLADVLTRAREQAPDIVSARLALEEARDGCSARPSGLRPTRRSMPLWAIERVRMRDLPTSSSAWVRLRAGCPPFRSHRWRQCGDRRKRREHRRGHQDGAPVGGVRLLPRGVRESANPAADCRTRTCAGVYATADRRFKAGDIAVLDVNIARASLAPRQGRARGSRGGEGAGARRAATVAAARHDVGVDGSLPPPGETDLNRALQPAAGAAGASRTRSRHSGGGSRAATGPELLEARIRARRSLLAGGTRSDPHRRHDCDAAPVLDRTGATGGRFGPRGQTSGRSSMRLERGCRWKSEPPSTHTTAGSPR